MRLKVFFASQSVKDFSNLFFANIFQKFLGLIRELVIAFFLGSSIIYANFLLLRVVADFFSQITAGNALKANLLPKFTMLYEKNKDVSLSEVFRFSKKSSYYLFFISQFIQTVVILLLNLENNLLFFVASLILSFSICFNFINTIFLTVFQARGLFLKYSYSSVTNSLVFTLLIYPLISVASFIGLALSRLTGIICMYFTFVRPLKKEISGIEVKLYNSDFNFPTLILGNFANIIIISSRFVSGADGSNNITFFMYAVVLLNALLTAVVTNISTILLRKIAIKKNSRLIFYSLLVSVFVGLCMVVMLHFFSTEIVKFVYLRGVFNISDVEQTAVYLYELSFAFLLLFVSTILFQPFLSLPIAKNKKNRKYISLLLLGTIVTGFLFSGFFDLDVQLETLIVIYTSSIMGLFLSIYSYYCYSKLTA
jgi:putative peptidoglycan lipid II flippase